MENQTAFKPVMTAEIDKDLKIDVVIKKEGDETSREAKASPHHQHDKETHGRNDDIDELTSTEEVKGPGVFSRMKEEAEAVVEAVLQKKDSDDKE